MPFTATILSDFIPVPLLFPPFVIVVKNNISQLQNLIVLWYLFFSWSQVWSREYVWDPLVWNCHWNRNLHNSLLYKWRHKKLGCQPSPAPATCRFSATRKRKRQLWRDEFELKVLKVIFNAIIAVFNPRLLYGCLFFLKYFCLAFVLYVTVRGDRMRKHLLRRLNWSLQVFFFLLFERMKCVHRWSRGSRRPRHITLILGRRWWSFLNRQRKTFKCLSSSPSVCRSIRCKGGV